VVTLNPKPSVDRAIREVGNAGLTADRRFQGVGRSQGSKLVAAMLELGQTAKRIYFPKWRAFCKNGMDMAKKICKS
jgi:hypothetical protein